MEKTKFRTFDFLPTFQNKEEYFTKITGLEDSGKRIFYLYLLLNLFSFVYGMIMGSYHSLIQAVVSGIKVPVLFTVVLIICFPAFFIIQFILGSKLKLSQMVSIVLSGFVLTTSIMVSFTPIVVFFLLTGGNYYFLQLLHIGVFIFSGVFGMIIIIDALRFSCEKKNIYPQTGVVVFRFWVVILAFVGIQMAWNLRPFLGDRGKPFELFRKYEGNFYTALIYSVKQLIDPDEKNDKNRDKGIKGESKSDTTLQFLNLYKK
ncbi:actin-binding WH2 domain-containing protein [candidate division KSB1 bacterium]